MSKNKIIGAASVILLAAILVLQFLPYWQYTTNMKIDGVKTDVEVTASMQGYVWLPEDNKDLTKLFQEETDNKKFAAGDVITLPVATLFLAVIGIVFTVINPNFKFLFLFPLAVGIIGIVCLLTNPVFKIQPDFNSLNYTLQFVCSILLTAIGAVKLGIVVTDIVKNWK